MDIKTLLHEMDALREKTNYINPDRWNCLCAKHGIGVRNAQNYLAEVNEIRRGRMTKDDCLETISELINEYDLMRNEDFGRITLKGFGDSYNWENKVCVFWRKDSESPIERITFSISDAFCIVSIAKMIMGGNEIISICRYGDTLPDDKDERYVGDIWEDDKKDVYEGDVFFTYKNIYGYDWDRSEKNGAYVMLDGCYRRLLWTNEYGYLKKGEPNVDEEFELGLVEGKFTHYIMTLDNCFARVGNIFADNGILKP